MSARLDTTEINGAQVRRVSGGALEYQRRDGTDLAWEVFIRETGGLSPWTVWAPCRDAALSQARAYRGYVSDNSIGPVFVTDPEASGWDVSDLIAACVWLGDIIATTQIAAQFSELFASAPKTRVA